MKAPNIVLDKMKTLTAINVLEPTTESTLARALKNDIEPSSLSIILEELLIEGLISKEKRHFRITYRGISLNHSQNSKKLRDISRMKYLLNTSKQRGGNFVGR